MVFSAILFVNNNKKKTKTLSPSFIYLLSGKPRALCILSTEDGLMVLGEKRNRTPSVLIKSIVNDILLKDGPGCWWTATRSLDDNTSLWLHLLGKINRAAGPRYSRGICLERIQVPPLF